MSTERIIGVDFGTSTSVIRVKRYKDGKPVEDRLSTKAVTFNMGSTMLPTLIRKIENGSYYGYDAQIAKKNSILYQNFKIKIESTDIQEKQQARELTKEFFKYIANVYKNQSAGGHLGVDGDTERTLISYPVKWSEETKHFMLETAKEAGFPNVEGIDEAQAAIHAVIVQNETILFKNGYLQNNKPVNIMLIDMGAGTTDIVISRYTPGEKAINEVLCTWPKGGDILFGGREVDELLSNYIRKKLPQDEAERVLKRCGTDTFKEWKDTMVSPALKRNETVTEFSALDVIIDMLDIEADYSFDRSDFEKNTESYLQKLPLLVKGSLKEANLNGSDIDLVVLTGGHSQWYFVKDILMDTNIQYGECGLNKIKSDFNRIISISLPQETVALGLVYDKLVSTNKSIHPSKEEIKNDCLSEKVAETAPHRTYASEAETAPHRTYVSEAETAPHRTYVSKAHSMHKQPNSEINLNTPRMERKIASYGDLVREFIELVKEPPVKNGIDDLPSDFMRQLREFNGLKEDEEIIYTFKMGWCGSAMYRNPSYRFLFTKSYFVVPEFNGVGFTKKGKNYLWSDFMNVKIGYESISLTKNPCLTFAGKRVHIIYYADALWTKSRVDKWRYFYLDLQKYLRDNAHRIHK